MTSRCLTAALLAVAAVGCGDGGPPSGEGATGPQVPVPGNTDALKSAAAVRATRRAFDGAPPVIPHVNFGPACTSCHTVAGMAVPGVGFAPPMPHEETAGMSGLSRCVQCHVFRMTEDEFRGNRFEGLQQDLRKGKRLHDGAPPVMPHSMAMRENCSACHDGPAAREEIRTPHPERERCVQCHVPQRTTEEFSR
jgi:cytochrome c-type protein NapB